MTLVSSVYDAFSGVFSNLPEIEQGSVYSEHPAMLPKYNPGNRLATFRTQARMYVPFATADAFDDFLRTLSWDAEPYARSLAIVGDAEFKALGYFDFFLQRANEAYQEKRQVTEVLSDSFVAYYFGQRAPVWSYSGAVLNTEHNQWYDAFHILYEDVLRGTRLADRGIAVRLSYDTKTVFGSLDSLTTSLSADNETFAPFQFQVLVHKVLYSPTNIQSTIITEALPVLRGAVAELEGGALDTRMTSTLDEARQDSSAVEAAREAVRGGFSAAELAARAFPDDPNAEKQLDLRPRGESTYDEEIPPGVKPINIYVTFDTINRPSS